jgi:2,5-diketo-D-gluconate reductase A
MKPTMTLAGGVEMPRCGLGTFKAGGAELRAAVATALSVGVRHIDTAAIYKAWGLSIGRVLHAAAVGGP